MLKANEMKNRDKGNNVDLYWKQYISISKQIYKLTRYL